MVTKLVKKISLLKNFLQRNINLELLNQKKAKEVLKEKRNKTLLNPRPNLLNNFR